MPPGASRIPAARAEHNAAALVRMWEWGRDSLEHCPPDRLDYGSAGARLRRELSRLARRQATATPGDGLDLRINLDNLYKMRRVASDFTGGEIDGLAEQIRRRRSRFSTSHLIRVLPVTAPEDRSAIITKAVRGSWALRTLERYVTVARGARRAGVGRRPSVPADRDQQLVLLEGLCLRWLRWTAAARRGLPTDVRRSVRDADAAVRSVQRGLGKHLPRPPAP